MSDEDRDVDVESGDEADKRAHHNALERKRRDHIKDSFCGLRDSIPSLEGEKSSRAQILHKATEHIQYMRRKNHSHQADIDELKRHNMILDQQVRQLEKARASGTLTLDPATAALLSPDMLLQAPSTDNVMVQADGKNEPVILERPNNAGDHDDYTIAPKRLKAEPP
ncbi:protein max-like isoform X2 [Hydractinia symbiolongicarpus]|uniref:protein max-like isoform X2 n=1 Tax=Hydractinia symbiolongicarpus TaxID=13093 RepID=UPI00254FEFAC|nr:protein max-like isoform X2 [Hydractinia symbiolongicarpus]